MSDTNASSYQLLNDIETYRDKIVALGDSTPYRSGYLDALSMAMFLVQAAIHRETLQREVDRLQGEIADMVKDTPRSVRIDVNDVERTAQAVAE